jgi:large subunit ribosomal protein L15
MQIHTLTRKNKQKTAKRVGRGGRHGKTSGRGTKGQSARAGNKKRPEMRDIIKKLPKLRGYKFNSVQDKPQVINLSRLGENFAAKEEVNPEVLVAKKLIRRQGGKTPKVKILGNGEITIALVFKDCTVSTAAREKITAAGGSIA